MSRNNFFNIFINNRVLSFSYRFRIMAVTANERIETYNTVRRLVSLRAVSGENKPVLRRD